MNNYKKSLKYFAIVVILLFVLIFLLQIIVAPLLMGGSGSFGLRPQTHGCFGLPIKSNLVRWLPDGDVELSILLHFRYRVASEISNRNYCLGQDIWFGE